MLNVECSNVQIFKFKGDPRIHSADQLFQESKARSVGSIPKKRDNVDSPEKDRNGSIDHHIIYRHSDNPRYLRPNGQIRTSPYLSQNNFHVKFGVGLPSPR